MKKKNKKNGFAMVEVLIAAVIVISIFTLIYNSIYPIIGFSRASENYDDIDSKYIAFYIKEMIETDGVKINPTESDGIDIDSVFMESNNAEGRPLIYSTYSYYNGIDGSMQGINWNIDNIIGDEHYLFSNELCDKFKENSNEKNNQFFCRKFITGANITNIYVTPYNVTRFKNYVKNSDSFSRSFKSYVSYMPTFSKNSVKSSYSSGYYRVIVEIKHTSYNTAEEYFYTYGTIEVKK